MFKICIIIDDRNVVIIAFLNLAKINAISVLAQFLFRATGYRKITVI